MYDALAGGLLGERGGSRRACARRRPGRRSCAGPAPTKSWRIGGCDGARGRADAAVVDRHVAPAEHALALGRRRCARAARSSSRAARRVGRQEAHRDAVAPGRRQLEVDASRAAARRAAAAGSRRRRRCRGSAPAAPRCSRLASASMRELRRPRGSHGCPGARRRRRRRRRARSGGRRGRRPAGAGVILVIFEGSRGRRSPSVRVVRAPEADANPSNVGAKKRSRGGLARSALASGCARSVIASS